MTWNDVVLAFWEFPLHDVEIRSANTACANSNEHLITNWLRIGSFAIHQWRCFYRARLLQNTCFHSCTYKRRLNEKASPGEPVGKALTILGVNDGTIGSPFQTYLTQPQI